MASWQDKVVKVMLAETSDLRKLARLVGHDPATFWRDANFRTADPSDQDLEGLDLSAATMPSQGIKAPDDVLGQLEEDLAKANRRSEPKIWAEARSALGDYWLRRSIADWTQAEACLDHATDHFIQAVDGYVDAGADREMAQGRYHLAKALLLLSDAAPGRATDAIDSAEIELRVASSAFEGLRAVQSLAWVLDARGSVWRRRARRQRKNTAKGMLERARESYNAAQSHVAGSNKLKFELHEKGAVRESFVVNATPRVIRQLDQYGQLQELERYWSTVTGPSSLGVAALAKIEHSALRLAFVELTRKPLGTTAREEIRKNLTDAIRTTESDELYLDWVEAQRCLAILNDMESVSQSGLSSESLEKNVSQDEEKPDEEIEASAASAALRIARAKLIEGDDTLRRVMTSPDDVSEKIEQALGLYAQAEDLYRLIEDNIQLDGEPGSAFAVLRRGVTHLLKAGLLTLSEPGIADCLEEARFALDLAAADLSGRVDVPLALAEAQDAQAFAIRLEARLLSKPDAADFLAEAAALHRRASRTEGLSRSVSYRYRTHFFGAERERNEQRQEALPAFQDMRTRAEKSLNSMNSRKSDRTSAAEQSGQMAVLAEFAMSVMSEAEFPSVSEARGQRVKRIKAAIDAAQEARELAEALFMPLDWLWARQTEAQLQVL